MQLVIHHPRYTFLCVPINMGSRGETKHQELGSNDFIAIFNSLKSLGSVF